MAQLNDEWKKREHQGDRRLPSTASMSTKRWIGDIEAVGGRHPWASRSSPMTGLAVSKAFDMLPAEAYLPRRPHSGG